MGFVIQLLTTGEEPTEYDGKYVKIYDPTCPENGDGGILEVTTDALEALEFPTLQEAVEKYTQAHGLRPDGRPNRPLTAWSVCFELLERSARDVAGQPDVVHG